MLQLRLDGFVLSLKRALSAEGRGLKAEMGILLLRLDGLAMSPGFVSFSSRRCSDPSCWRGSLRAQLSGYGFDMLHLTLDEFVLSLLHALFAVREGCGLRVILDMLQLGLDGLVLSLRFALSPWHCSDFPLTVQYPACPTLWNRGIVGLACCSRRLMGSSCR